VSSAPQQRVEVRGKPACGHHRDLLQAAMPGSRVAAMVSRGGRPDLAGRAALEAVRAPTLLIVGGDDHDVLRLNKDAYRLLHCEKRLDVVPGATHLFPEPGRLEEVAMMAASWFSSHFDALLRRR
jgi:putative phosphoribosyl transferase